MESLRSWQPLHVCYQVKSRLDENPERTWRHLVRIARNLATCVQEVHEAGLVVGDLNESNVLVSGQCMVKLIDVDSFQCEVEGQVFYCPVGKAELMAPEIQGRSLATLVRTPDQDAFALAVLIFQTLMFGRHPFAGRPQGDIEVTLEETIVQGWYPYVEDRRHPMGAPEGFTVGWLPEELREMFEEAFLPERGSRPTAEAWAQALKTLEGELETCTLNPSHVRWAGLHRCPWCVLERRWGLALFKPRFDEEYLPSTNAKFLWEKIESVSAPAQYEPPKILALRDFAGLKKGPIGVVQYGWPAIVIFLIAIFGLKDFLSSQLDLPPAGWFVVGCLGLAGCYGMYLAAVNYVLDRARSQLVALSQKWTTTASQHIFELEKDHISRIYANLKDSRERLEGERRRVLKAHYGRELQEYLTRYSVRSFAGGVSQDVMNLLTGTHQFFTAADIEPRARELQRVVPDEIYRTLVNWRDEIENRFWNTSSYRLTASMERDARKMVAKEDADMLAVLQRAPGKLETLRDRLDGAQAEIFEQSKKPAATANAFGPIVATLWFWKRF